MNIWRAPSNPPFGAWLVAVAFGTTLFAGGAEISQAERDRLREKRVVGCYSVTLGPWKPPFPPDIDPDKVEVRLPPRIQFTLDRGTVRWLKDKLLVRPAPGAPSGYLKVGYWSVSGRYTVNAGWSDGYTVLGLTVQEDEHDLRGNVKAVWDSGDPPQDRKVFLNRISCESDSSGEPQ